MQKSFIFDINKCTGCQACQIACTIENQLDPGMNWREVHTYNADHHPGVPGFHLSLACNHCVDPPCMKHCPAEAYTKNDATGTVTVNDKLCIGCKYCTWACPYDAPQFNAGTGLIEKCTFCQHRLEDGMEPACVSLCPTGALQFGDFDGADGGRSVPGFPQTPVTPAIQFVPLRGERTAPEATAAIDLDPTGSPDRRNRPTSKITLRSEWSLIVFTLVAAILVAWMAAIPPLWIVPSLTFLAIGMMGAGLSTMHLGRKRRAYRSVLNWRHSWLSREVILYTTFLALCALCLLLAPPLRGIAVVVGYAALFAMDNVYRVTGTRGLWIHSAQVLPSGVLFFGVLSGFDGVFFLALFLKLALYAYRKYRHAEERRPLRPLAAAARVLFGFLIPLSLWPAPVGVIFASVLLGEIIDRCEYYLDLDIPAPRKQMALDLGVAIENQIAAQRESRI